MNKSDNQREIFTMFSKAIFLKISNKQDYSGKS